MQPILSSPRSGLSRACRRLVLAGCCGCLIGGGGCRSPGTSAARAQDEPVRVADVMGPTERRLKTVAWQDRREQLKASGVTLEGLAEFEDAQRLYDAGEFRAAEVDFKKLAKQRARDRLNWQSRLQELFAREKPEHEGDYGDPIEEDALFMAAESQFAQQKYSFAQDSYGVLLEKYPSSRHLDTVTRRLFFVAQFWLKLPGRSAEASDIELVDHAAGEHGTPTVEVQSGPSRWPIVPNLTDRKRPVFDTDGRALQALETIWRHDAAGPLADDALMLQATYYHSKGDFVEASRLYALVREQYPESTHFQDAFLLGSHVTLASYSGPAYDDRPLRDARDLKQTSRQLFGNLSPEQKARLDAELLKINEMEVEREWKKVEFYLLKNQPAAVTLQCHQIIHRYPDSPYATRAWNVLEWQQGRRKGALDLDSLSFRRPAPSTPSEQTTDARPSEPPATRESAERKSWLRRFGNILRPVDQQPELQSVEPEAPDDESTDPNAADPVGRVRL